MRYDLTPLYRSTIGFDRLATLFDQIGALDDAPAYPPYNIERLGENDYRISMAVAGFGQDELSLEVKESTLTVKGVKASDDKDRAFLHRGIAARSFERRFQLADHVQVTAADLVNGLLHVDLKREIPEAKKPRQIAIGGGEPASQPQIIDAEAA